MSKKRKKHHSSNRAKKGSQHQDDLRRRVIQLFDENIGQTFTVRQVIKTLRIRDKISKNMIPDLLFTLERQDLLAKRRNNFTSTRDPEALKGIVDHVNAKFGYVVIPEREEDIWVKTSDLKGALDGDTVHVAIKGKRHGARPEGVVTEIVERNRNEFVGRVELSNNFGFVIPDNRKIYTDFYVYPEKLM
ncbi:MAG: ribonuclease R, partial [Bacteroidota bacterium]